MTLPGYSDDDRIELRNDTTGESVDLWESYHYDSDFLTPTDGWSFQSGYGPLVDSMRSRFSPGTRVSLVVNGLVQASGYVDAYAMKSARSGVGFEVRGRDTLAPAVDAGISPKTTFTTGSTVGDVIRQCFQPFGFNIISTSDILNRNALTGVNRASASTRVIKPETIVPDTVQQPGSDGVVRTIIVGAGTRYPAVTELFDPTRAAGFLAQTFEQFKPTPGEGVFEFAVRVVKRFGAWIWASGDGNTLIVDYPDYNQAALYSIAHKLSGALTNNVEDASATLDLTDQPSVIIATGFGGGGFNDRSTIKVAMVNELTGTDGSGNIVDDVQRAINKYPGIDVLPVRKQLFAAAREYRSTAARPIYLHDDESKNIGQLRAFVKREMAKRQRKGLSVHYTVQGHTQNGKAWAVGTMVNVDDDVLGIHEPLWVMGRTFTKGMNGTRTQLSLIRPYTLDLMVE